MTYNVFSGTLNPTSVVLVASKLLVSNTSHKVVEARDELIRHWPIIGRPIIGRFLLIQEWEDGGGGHWLVRMEWCPAGWSVCLPLLIFPCTIKSGSSLFAPVHPIGTGKRAIKWLWCGVVEVVLLIQKVTKTDVLAF